MNFLFEKNSITKNINLLAFVVNLHFISKLDQFCTFEKNIQTLKLKSFFNFKTLLVFMLFGIGAGSIVYYNLMPRHKALLKTRILHGLGIIDNDWEISLDKNILKLESPELLVDGIYQSMDGPQAFLYLDINPNTVNHKWITGFKTEVWKDGTNSHNNDFLCHTNIDFYDAIHYRNLNMPKRVNVIYPRLGTLSNGLNELNFPEGFGFPVAKDDKFIVASRTLNHNIEDAFFKVKHHIEFKMEEGSKPMKPLLPKALVLLLDYDRENPYNSKKKNDPNLCTPVDLKTHSFLDEKGVKMAVHWKLPKGRHQYEYDVTFQLDLKEDTSIHAMAAHLHPQAESFTLFDVTENKPVYNFDCENYSEKIGLKHVPVYSNPEGIPIKADHRYKLILVTNNPSDGFRDMMAVLFVYVYDREMDEQIKMENLVSAVQE
jgi:hypothetical protein